MHFLNITILLNEKVRTCKQRHCSNHALLWVATKLKHVFTDFLFTKFSKCFNLSQTTFPCLSPLQSSLSSSTSLFQCHTHKTLTPRQQRLGFNPFSGTPTFGLLPCQIILTVSTSPQAAVSEVSGIEWTWHPWKESRENMHKDIVTQSLRRQDVSREVISIHDRLQWLHYYIFLDNSYSSRCITKTTGQNVCTILAARCNWPSA